MPRHLSRVLAAVTVLLGLPQAAALAQQGTTISGRVTSDRNAPLQSVSVAIATLGVGGFTDEQGRYSFTVPQSRSAGQSVQLAARRIGFQAKSVTITLSGGTVTQDFSLAATAAQLTGVVVTALSQQREKATIGTSQQAVSGEQLTQVQQPTLISALSGKVSGLQINQSGNMGGSQRIVIRGAGSILGENQPVFIVDGVGERRPRLRHGDLRPQHGRRRERDGTQGPERRRAVWFACVQRRSCDHHEERSRRDARYQVQFHESSVGGPAVHLS